MDAAPTLIPEGPGSYQFKDSVGRVIYVGSDPVTEGEGASRRTFFPVRVIIDKTALKANRDIALKPGMPAELFIETGSRSMISYLTKPFQDQFARAFRD